MVSGFMGILYIAILVVDKRVSSQNLVLIKGDISSKIEGNRGTVAILLK